MNLEELISKGGLTFIPIILFSILGLALSIERLIKLRTSKIMPESFVHQIQQALSQKNYDECLAIARLADHPLARIIEKSFNQLKEGKAVLESYIEKLAQHELGKLNQNLRLLGAIAMLSPMLGLLGTVLGMIKAFDQISLKGTGNPAVVASGISEALLSTAAGLIVGLLALLSYHYLKGKIEKIVSRMEALLLDVLLKVH